MRPSPPGGSSSEHAPITSAHPRTGMRPLLPIPAHCPRQAKFTPWSASQAFDVLGRLAVELGLGGVRRGCAPACCRVVQPVRQVDRHGLRHHDRRVLVDAPHDALFDAVEQPAHGLVGVLEAHGELLDRGVLARRVDDGHGTADEVGQRDQGPIGGHAPWPTHVELDDAPDAVLVVHEVEALVDFVERDPVRDERVDVELAVQVELHELRDLVAALDAAEGRARDAATGDQVARGDVQRLALAGHAGDRAQAPAHARGLDGLPHDLDDAGGLERVVGAHPAGLVEHLLDGVGAADPGVGRALALRELQPVLGQVDADDPLGALQPRAGDRAEADHARAVDDDRRARLDLGGEHRRAHAGREAAGEQRAAVQRRLLGHLGQRDLRHHRVLGERARAHEVADRLAVAGEAHGPVRAGGPGSARRGSPCTGSSWASGSARTRDTAARTASRRDHRRRGP